MTEILQNSFFENIVNKFNTNIYVFGIFMILMNMGSKYIELDLKETHRKFLSSKLVRRLLIFTISFIATRDIIASLIITATFTIIVLNLLNSDSQYCILPDHIKKLDINNDGKISPDEIKKAYDLLKKSGKL